MEDSKFARTWFVSKLSFASVFPTLIPFALFLNKMTLNTIFYELYAALGLAIPLKVQGW